MKGWEGREVGRAVRNWRLDCFGRKGVLTEPRFHFLLGH